MDLDKQILEYFYICNPVTLTTKIQAIKDALAQNAQSLELRSDFDRTLTYRSITWETLYRALPDKGKKESNEERIEKLALQKMGALPTSELLDWTVRELERHVKYGTLAAAITNAAKDVSLRAGVPELFDFCNAHKIRCYIISAGVTNIIEAVTKKNHLQIKPEHIIANTLQADENGVMASWDKDYMVHTRNKRIRVESRHIPSPGKRNIIVMGDSLDDAHMADDTTDCTVIRIRIPTMDSTVNAAYLEESWKEKPTEDRKGFDLVLRSPDVSGIQKFLQLLFEK